jgi:hypothetical protein
MDKITHAIYDLKTALEYIENQEAQYTALLAVAERMEKALEGANKYTNPAGRTFQAAWLALEAFRKLKEPPTERE